MLLPGTIAAEPPTARAIWRSELVETIKLAWPIALTQLGQIAMMTTDLALIGRLGDGAGRFGRGAFAETIKLAWPIALTQLGQIAMMTTDLALIGRLGDGAVAAV